MYNMMPEAYIPYGKFNITYVCVYMYKHCHNLKKQKTKLSHKIIIVATLFPNSGYS